MSRSTSAGTHDYHVGECYPDRQAIAAARARGYDVSWLKARHFSERDFSTYDHLLAMDRGHLSILMRRSLPEHRHKIRLFMDHAPHLPHREVRILTTATTPDSNWRCWIWWRLRPAVCWNTSDPGSRRATATATQSNAAFALYPLPRRRAPQSIISLAPRRSASRSAASGSLTTGSAGAADDAAARARRRWQR